MVDRALPALLFTLTCLSWSCVTTQPDCKEPVVISPSEADPALEARKQANIDKRRAPTIGRPFRARAKGQGLLRLGKINVKDNIADIEVDGRMQRGFVYTTQDWREYGYTLLDVIITSDEAYTVLYLYCRGDKLTDVYWESYSDDLQYEKLTGTCSLDKKKVTRTKHAFERVKPPIGGLVQGFTVKGPNVDMKASGEGTITLMNTTYQVRAFSFVGCTDCVNAQRKGWEELHVWLGTEDEDCFGVLYLYSDAAVQGLPMGGQAAQLGYGFCTNPVKDLPNTLLRATWKR